jgi:hypothetical protein
MKNTLDRLHGHLKIETINKETGAIIDIFEDKNLFLDLGKTSVVRGMGDVTTNYCVENLRFGNDFGDPGSFSIFVPEDAQLDFDSATQDEVFTISRPALQATYPNFETVEFSTLLDGDEILDQYPGEVDVRYTSVALYNFLNDPIAYRRFSVRSISRLVSVSVTWSLSFEEPA